MYTVKKKEVISIMYSFTPSDLNFQTMDVDAQIDLAKFFLQKTGPLEPFLSFSRYALTYKILFCKHLKKSLYFALKVCWFASLFCYFKNVLRIHISFLIRSRVIKKILIPSNVIGHIYKAFFLKLVFKIGFWPVLCLKLQI